jgi:hypothetical protein
MRLKNRIKELEEQLEQANKHTYIHETLVVMENYILNMETLIMKRF